MPKALQARFLPAAVPAKCVLMTEAYSVPDILEEPFGRNLATEARLADKFIDFTSNRIELGALQIAALRIRDLIGSRAALGRSRHDVGKRNPPVGQGVTVLAAA